MSESNESNTAKIVIVAPENLQYCIRILNDYDPCITTAFTRGPSTNINFSYKDKNGNWVSIVEFNNEEPLNCPMVTIFKGTSEQEKKRQKKLFIDNRYTHFYFPGGYTPFKDSPKDQYLIIILSSTSEKTSATYYYKCLTEEQFNEYEKGLIKIPNIEKTSGLDSQQNQNESNTKPQTENDLNNCL